MNDFAAALAPKSDQINAQDLIAGDMTITIAAVKVTPGQEQPVSIRFDGNEKVWRPCKTTGRILMAAWGADTSVYPGRSVQLYLDPEVKWCGMKVGGIRIRAMSHIDSELRIALAESKQNRKLFTIKPLAGAPRRADPPRRPVDGSAENPSVAKAKAAAEKGSDHFRTWYNTDEGKECRASGAITESVLSECRIIASGADALGPKLAADEVGKALADADPFNADTATDAEVQARLANEHAEFERQRAADEAALTGAS